MKRLVLILTLFLLSTFADAQDIITIAGNGIAGYVGDNGPAINASINNQFQIAVDRIGNLFIADRNNNCIRRVDSFGTITTIAGSGTSGYAGDSGPSVNALLNFPCAVATDDLGNIYISDSFNRRIRKIGSNGIISTVAGTGLTGYNGDNISASTANLDTPLGIAVDVSGNIFFSDYGHYRIRKIDTAGIITTIAGNGTPGFSGDNGQAVFALVNQVTGISIGNEGNIYFSDSYNNRIRKIDTFGVVTTIAGTGAGGYTGDNGPAISATMYYPSHIVVDKLNNIYVAGYYSQSVRRIDPLGVITRVAGTGVAGFSGDGGTAINAEINNPIGVAVDTLGNIYISDAGNNRIRKVDNSVSVKTLVGKSAAIELFPNPSNGSFYISGYDATVASLPVEITDVTGKLILKAELLNKNGIAEVSYDLPKGIFFVTINNGGLRITKKIVINK